MKHMYSTLTGAGVLAMASLLLLGACGGAESRLAGHLERGREFLEAGNVDKARVEFGNAMQISPDDIEARYYSGIVAERQGKLRDAVGLFQSVVDAQTDHAGARANLSRIYALAGDPAKALTLVEPGLAKYPDDPDLLTSRGAARAQLKDLDGARADAEKAVALAPANESAVALLASLYHRAGETGRAIEVLKGAVAAKPESVDLRQILASLYSGTSDEALAQAQLEKIVELRPAELANRMRLAMYFVRLKKPDEAEKALLAAIEALPDDDQAKLAYVDFLSSQRAPARGEKALTAFIERNPRDYDLRLGLGDMQRRGGKADAATQTFRAIVEEGGEAPQAAVARTRLAGIAAERGKLEEADALIAEALAKSPRDTEALLLRGTLALQRKDAPAAIADLRSVLGDQPGSVPILRVLARAYLLNGESALAEEQLRLATALWQRDPGPRVELAQVLLQTNRPAQAVAALEETALKFPDDVSVRELRVRAYLATNEPEAALRGAGDIKTLKPDLAVGAYLAGLAQQASDRPDEAVKEFEAALRLQPTAMDALAALVRVETSRGRIDPAIARVNQAILKAPDNAIARNLLAELHVAKKDYPQASEQGERAIKLAPAWSTAYFTLGVSYIGSGNLDAAIKTFSKGVDATRGDLRLVTELTALYERLNRIDDAVAVYERLLKTDPKSELAANNLAMLLVTFRKDEASTQRALQLSAPFAKSGNAALLDTFGWVRLAGGKTDEALPALERASTLAPDSKVIRYHLAMAQVRAGKESEAKSNLELAMSGSPSFAGVDEARSTLAGLRRRG
jgi:uncharacterized protein (TIGR02996 family)